MQVKRMGILNKMIHKFSFICNNIQNLRAHLAELMTHPLRFTALKEIRKWLDV
jgi:hypothetical protein